jgi:hypothetical protein
MWRTNHRHSGRDLWMLSENWRWDNESIKELNNWPLSVVIRLLVITVAFGPFWTEGHWGSTPKKSAVISSTKMELFNYRRFFWTLRLVIDHSWLCGLTGNLGTSPSDGINKFSPENRGWKPRIDQNWVICSLHDSANAWPLRGKRSTRDWKVQSGIHSLRAPSFWMMGGTNKRRW